MKKSIVKYLLSSLFIFFVVCGIAKAEDRTISIPRDGSSVQFLDGTSYYGTNCEGANNLQFFTVTKKSGGSYDVKIKDGINVSSGSENLICTYSVHYGMVGDTHKILDTNGSISFTFSFTNSVEDMIVNATLSKYDPILDIRNYLPNFSGISSVELDANGQQYLDNQCVDDQCSFTVKDETFNTLSGNDIEINGNVVYTTFDGQNVNVELHVVVRGFYTILASAGDYGVCEFTSIWEVSPYSANAYKTKYDDSTSGRISLPNCDASKSAAPVEFYGWVYINPNDAIQESQNVMVSNVCATFPKVEGNLEELIKAGVNKFYTCYVGKSYLYLNPSGGTISVQSDWEEQNGKYLIVQEGEFILPEITQFPNNLKNDENNRVNYYWQASNDRNKRYYAGDRVVPSGQTFTAIYETDSFVENHLYENSIMYVGDSQLYALTTVKFDTCSTNSNLVEVQVDSETGGCMMTAKGETGEDEFVEVYGYNADRDQTYTLKLKILSRAGFSESGDSEFVIQFDDYAIAGYGQTGTITPAPVTKPASGNIEGLKFEDSATPSCSLYRIDIIYSSNSKFGDYLYGSQVAGFNYKYANGEYTLLSDPTNYDLSAIGYPDYRYALLYHDSFRARCDEQNNDDTKSYPTICLDPIVGPPSKAVEQSLDVAKSVFGEDIVNFLYSVIQDTRYQDKLTEVYSDDYTKPRGQDYHSQDVNNSTRIAINFVARLLVAESDEGLRRDELDKNQNSLAAKNYYGFMYLTKYKGHHVDMINNSSIYWNSKYKNKVKEILDAFDKGEFSNPTLHTTKQTNVQANLDESTKTVTITGELDLPDDIKISDLNLNGMKTSDDGKLKARIVCADGLICNIVSISKTDFEFTVKYNDPALLNKENAVNLYLYFKSYQDKNSLVFLDSPNANDNLQRMVIFKDEHVYMFRYGGEIKSAPACDLNDFPGDPDTWNTEQKQEFVNKNCCQLITDRNDVRYQKLCGDNCVKNTYSIACDTNLNGSSYNAYDIYTVNEGYDKVNNQEKIGACVVDVTKTDLNNNDSRNATDRMTDAVGNSLSLPDYDGNQYCRVSCKEDWNLKTPGFKNFVGENGAVKAGQYFRLNEEIFLGGTRTCVTTYIDYKHYKDDIKILSGKMIAAYNTYVEAQTAINNVKDNAGHSDSGSQPEYVDYVTGYEKSEGPYCTSYKSCRGEDGNSYECCNQYSQDWVATYSKCAVYVAHTHEGTTVSGLYDPKNFSGTSGALTDTSTQTNVTVGTESITLPVGSTPKPNGKCESKDEGLTSAQSAVQYLLDNRLKYTVGNENLTSFKNYDRYEHKTMAGDTYNPPSGLLESIKRSAKLSLVEFKNDLNEKVKDMGACQNFYMNNTIDDSDDYFYGETKVEKAYQKTGNGYDAGSQKLYISPTEIPSPYEPDIRYQYEEYEYMTLVGNNNYLVPDAKENDKVVGSDHQNICKDTGMVDSNGKSIQLCVNKINTYGYQSDGWTNEGEGADYGGEDNKNDGNSYVDAEATEDSMMVCYPNGDSVKCESGNFYYYELNYIKQTLSNGGYYRNYGDFYVSQYSDIKIFAASRNEALDKANARGSSVNDWGPLGGNSFPIGIDTRRNIYQYMYSFGNIGIYNDTNKAGIDPTEGRIIGGSANGTNASTNAGGESVPTSRPAVVADHTHACFYEVFEELCQCCGLPVTSTVVMPSKVDTKNYLQENNYQYNFSNDDKNSNGGSLGFYTTTVSLYDLDGNPSEENLSTNWSVNDTFRVYGNTYSTDKGGVLATAIVSVGENIYDRKPEYSYTLDPAAMAKIRDYNELHGYEHNISTLKNYGACAIASDRADCTSVLSSNYTEDETIIFTHYGSQFLEDLDQDYTTEGYKNLSSRKNANNICYITNTELSGKSPDLQDGNYSNCRWVDYVMAKENTTLLKGDEYIVEMNDVKYFRLAFK